MRKLVLFDIDGTLIIGGKLFQRCFEEAYVGMSENWGGRAQFPKVSFSGKTDPLICEEVFRQGSHGTLSLQQFTHQLMDGYLSRVEKHLGAGGAAAAQEVTVLPGVKALLEKLNAQPNLVIGLLTGNVKRGADLKLKAVGLDKLFSFGVYGDGCTIRNRLPSRAVDKAIREYGVVFRGKSLVIIGDTHFDVNCGKSVGARTIAVGTGRADLKDAILAAKPDFYFDTLEDPKIIQAITLD